jgi:NTE family protein
MVTRYRVGIALGGGAARGWAHIGVLRALAAAGVVPEIVAGASVGSLVGAAYAAGRLEALESWVRGLSRLDVLKLLDARLSGGVIEGNRVMQAIGELLSDQPIEALPRPYAAVATDLETGRTVWLRTGSTVAAVRASCAMPGLLPPVRHDGRWLVDGGLVDPVPVTLCRVLGADFVIAVDLSAYRYRPARTSAGRPDAGPRHRARPVIAGELGSYLERLQDFVGDWLELGNPDRSREPGIFDVVSASINIMQQRITRGRLAGDPPDVEITPQLQTIGMMDYHRAADAIERGVAAVEERLDQLAVLTGDAT